MYKNRITDLFGIKYPIIQAGMVWCSGWELASAVSNSGGLGLIGAGSMPPEVLTLQIRRCRKATNKPFGVNVPLLYSRIEDTLEVIIAEKVEIVFTSAGNPANWTGHLKDHGITVAHVVSSTRFAKKCQEAGADAVVAEGFEAGGHNGREETTTFCLIPLVRDAVDLPLIAAGGIANGKSMLASFVLGAEGVQIGSRFVASNESSAHPAFKNRVLASVEGDTELVLKQLAPARLLKNEFYQRVKSAELRGCTPDQLRSLLGTGRAKMGMFEGDLVEGELEIGQISASITEIKPAGEIVDIIWEEFMDACEKMRSSCPR
jgi:enoyl-[acyl-carrier protein] reductase II